MVLKLVPFLSQASAKSLYKYKSYIQNLQNPKNGLIKKISALKPIKYPTNGFQLVLGKKMDDVWNFRGQRLWPSFINSKS